MRDLITLVCEGCKRKNYTTTKNKKKTTDKLAFRKFCPACRSHTSHKEGKVYGPGRDQPHGVSSSNG